MTRRTLLLAGGAAALLAGCGEEDEGSAAVAPADVLLASLAAERALAAATSGSDRRLVRRVSRRAAERARLLAAAVSEEGGRPHDAPAPSPAGEEEPFRIIARADDAVAAHIAGLPTLDRRELRAFGVTLVTGAAADRAVLGDELLHPSDAFPGDNP